MGYDFGSLIYMYIYIYIFAFAFCPCFNASFCCSFLYVCSLIVLVMALQNLRFLCSSKNKNNVDLAVTNTERELQNFVKPSRLKYLCY